MIQPVLHGVLWFKFAEAVFRRFRTEFCGEAFQMTVMIVTCKGNTEALG